ncbi:MAG: universal stress protein UspA [Clostridiales bacterium]|nr:MAG: universal stress protein UspA [Clostridiales bacterium]
MKTHNIMVCVTQQKSCKRLIEAGAAIAKEEDGNLYVIHVVKEGWKYFGKLKEADAIEYLFEESKKNGGDLTIVKADDIVGTLKKFAREKEIDIIVMGKSREKTADQDMIKRFRGKGLKEIELKIVT